MDGCIFCKIAAGEIPSPRVYEDEYVIAIDDIHPVAKIHTLIIPKTHYDDILALGDDGVGGDCAALQSVCLSIHRAIREVARRKGVARTGFRVISNCGPDGAQTVPHLHYHVLGGQNLGAKLV